MSCKLTAMTTSAAPAAASVREWQRCVTLASSSRARPPGGCGDLPGSRQPGRGGRRRAPLRSGPCEDRDLARRPCAEVRPPWGPSRRPTRRCATVRAGQSMLAPGTAPSLKPRAGRRSETPPPPGELRGLVVPAHRPVRSAKRLTSPRSGSRRRSGRALSAQAHRPRADCSRPRRSSAVPGCCFSRSRSTVLATRVSVAARLRRGRAAERRRSEACDGRLTRQVMAACAGRGRAHLEACRAWISWPHTPRSAWATVARLRGRSPRRAWRDGPRSESRAYRRWKSVVSSSSASTNRASTTACSSEASTRIGPDASCLAQAHLPPAGGRARLPPP
jgi:hypothetical protein